MGQDETYDYLILGGGIGGLGAGALLAARGKRVCLVERQSDVGGYARSFKVGTFEFCHEVQYLMGCEPGGPVRRFLDLIGVPMEFNYFDADGFDVIVGDDVRFAIPTSAEKFRDRLSERFPESRAGIGRYFATMRRIFDESNGYDRVLTPMEIVRSPLKHWGLVRHMRRTVGEMFDRFDLPAEARFILAGQAGNLASSPDEASFLMYCGMQEAYLRCAAYPKLGMGHFIRKIAERISSSPGCRILTGHDVFRVGTDRSGVTEVDTTAGKIKARHYISNLDPQRTYELAGEPRPLRPYAYSDSVFTLYLGFKDLDLAAHGFGRRNFWYHADTDIDRSFRALTREHRYDKPWMFISTPSLLTNADVLCPKGHSSLVALTFVDHRHFEELRQKSPVAYEAQKEQLVAAFLDVLGHQFIPDVRRYVVAQHVETPVDLFDALAHPSANAYGARLTPRNYGIRRLTSKSRWRNLDFVGASTAYPGIMGVLLGSMDLAAKEGRNERRPANI